MHHTFSHIVIFSVSAFSHKLSSTLNRLAIEQNWDGKRGLGATYRLEVRDERNVVDTRKLGKSDEIYG
mgnify:CR=1 FL=1